MTEEAAVPRRSGGWKLAARIGVTVVFPSGMITRHLESSEAAQPEHLRRPIAGDDDLTAMLESNPAMAAIGM